MRNVYFAKGPLHGAIKEMDYAPRYWYVPLPLPIMAVLDPPHKVPRGEYELVTHDVYVYMGER